MKIDPPPFDHAMVYIDKLGDLSVLDYSVYPPAYTRR